MWNMTSTSNRPARDVYTWGGFFGPMPTRNFSALERGDDRRFMYPRAIAAAVRGMWTMPMLFRSRVG